MKTALQTAILERSEAKNWDEARLEWVLFEIGEGSGQCVCGKKPIKQIYTLHNRVNQKMTVVGNECIKDILGFDHRKLVEGFAKITANLDASLNDEVFGFVCQKFSGLSDADKDFYRKYWRKKKLTIQQHQQRRNINQVLIQQWGKYVGK
jgi:hypothetical protein